MSQSFSTLLAFGLAVVLGAGCGGSDIAKAERGERGSALYRKAIAAEQSGDVKGAIDLLNKVLIDEPRSFSAHFQLATLLHDHEEDYVGAIYHYKQYLYLRPESEKSTLARDRIRIAEQLLAPQILRRVGDSVQGISQAHLLNENTRLNRIITTLEGEKSVLLEEKTRSEKELAALQDDNTRLREILKRMRVSEQAEAPSVSLVKKVEAAVKGEPAERPAAKMDAKALRELREEAKSLSDAADAEERQPVVAMPKTEDVLKKVQGRLDGAAAAKVQAPPVPPPPVESVKEPPKGDAPAKASLSELNPFKKSESKPQPTKDIRTYVVQPGDTLFRVAEKHYGDSTKWTRIRDANRTRIDPDGRIRAGQIIIVP